MNKPETIRNYYVNFFLEKCQSVESCQLFFMCSTNTLKALLIECFLFQWFTLPFFGLVIHFLLSRTNPKLQLGKKSLFASVSLSHASYGLALLHPLGFDLALAIHILISAILGYSFYNAKKEPEIRLLVVKTVLSCAGFVVLKLADFYLAELHLIFEIFSGHFLSKVCDVMQIYYSLLIMEADLYDSSPQITEMGQKKK